MHGHIPLEIVIWLKCIILFSKNTIDTAILAELCRSICSRDHDPFCLIDPIMFHIQNKQLRLARGIFTSLLSQIPAGKTFPICRAFLCHSRVRADLYKSRSFINGNLLRQVRTPELWQFLYKRKNVIYRLSPQKLQSDFQQINSFRNCQKNALGL